MGTGAELDLCVKAHETLKAEGIRSRVVSHAVLVWFEAQDKAYRDSVLPPSVTARVAVEAASPLGWDRYAGATGEIIAMRSFGASAPDRRPVQEVRLHRRARLPTAAQGRQARGDRRDRPA